MNSCRMITWIQTPQCIPVAVVSIYKVGMYYYGSPVRTVRTVADPGFPTGWVPTQGGEVLAYYLAQFLPRTA